MVGVRADIAVENKAVDIFHIGGKAAVQFIISFRGKSFVGFAPVDFIMDGRGIDKKAVLWAATGIFTGLPRQGAGGDQVALATVKGLLYQGGNL